MYKLQTVTRKFMHKLLFMQKIYAEITNNNYAEITLSVGNKRKFMDHHNFNLKVRKLQN